MRVVEATTTGRSDIVRERAEANRNRAAVRYGAAISSTTIVFEQRAIADRNRGAAVVKDSATHELSLVARERAVDDCSRIVVADSATPSAA